MALVVALALVAAACSDSGGGESGAAVSSAPDTAPVSTPRAGQLEVAEYTETFVDPTRVTAAPAAAPERALITTIRVPESGGPFPLIVFAHGFDGHPRKFGELTTAWAEAGYVVAVPRFPLTSDEVEEGVIADVADQPGDVSFVIDEMLRLNEEEGSVVAGRIDPDRIGVGGLSLGGITTLGVTYNACCRDERVDGAVVMAGLQYPFPGAYEIVDVPLLLFHGDADPVLPYDSSVDTFAVASPPKFFVTILGGGHSQPFEDVEDPADEMVRSVSVDFWDLYLRDDPEALDRLLADADVPNLATLQDDAG